jgi:hypothetical protein
MKTIYSKTLCASFLTLLILGLDGCMTYSAVQRAEGHTSEWVMVEKREQVIQHDGISTVIRQNPSTGEKTETRFIRASEVGGYAYKPNVAYYGFLPLTVPADIVTSPFQILYFWGADWGTP